jgi:hypothetical protein
MSLQLRKISDKRKVMNFVTIETKPFTADKAADLTGVDRRVVSNYLRTFEIEGKIKKIGKQGSGYLYSKIYKIEKTSKTPLENSTKADEIEELISQKGYSSLREIAQKANCSHEFVRQVIEIRKISVQFKGYIHSEKFKQFIIENGNIESNQSVSNY